MQPLTLFAGAFSPFICCFILPLFFASFPGQNNRARASRVMLACWHRAARQASQGSIPNGNRVTGESRFVEQRECSLSTSIGSKQHSPVDHHSTSADLVSLGVCLAAYCGLQVASAYIQNQKLFSEAKMRRRLAFTSQTWHKATFPWISMHRCLLAYRWR
jgi:hypothetical protein